MAMHKGRILAIDTGSTSTKIGYFVDGQLAFEENIKHSSHELGSYQDVMDQEGMRMEAVRVFLQGKDIHAGDIDIVMGRGGLFSPVVTGVYEVNPDMREVLVSCRDGRHACNLSAVIAQDIANEISEKNAARGNVMPFGPCKAYVADPPMADEMLPECRIGGLPEFQRRAFFHALNSRAIVREYLRRHGHDKNDITAIVAHLGGGITVTLHRNGKVIDTNNGLGGEGPFSPERAGTCAGLQLVDMCFSGRYTENEIKRKLVGQGGAVAFFGTNDLQDLVRRGQEGDHKAYVWTRAFVLNIAKYIASEAATVCGKVDVILLTGGVARSSFVVEGIRERIGFIAPVEVYPGEAELQSLAEHGCMILEGKEEILDYHKDAPHPDPFKD
jgi:butyrate kinase